MGYGLSARDVRESDEIASDIEALEKHRDAIAGIVGAIAAGAAIDEINDLISPMQVKAASIIDGSNYRADRNAVIAARRAA